MMLVCLQKSGVPAKWEWAGVRCRDTCQRMKKPSLRYLKKKKNVISIFAYMLCIMIYVLPR